jgi:hypothetical protein
LYALLQEAILTVSDENKVIQYPIHIFCTDLSVSSQRLERAIFYRFRQSLGKPIEDHLNDVRGGDRRRLMVSSTSIAHGGCIAPEAKFHSSQYMICMHHACVVAFFIRDRNQAPISIHTSESRYRDHKPKYEKINVC